MLWVVYVELCKEWQEQQKREEKDEKEEQLRKVSIL
jgi:hypothetical protein